MKPLFAAASVFISVLLSVILIGSSTLAQDSKAGVRANQAPALDPTSAVAPTPTTSIDMGNSFTGIMDPFDYDQRGRRDPFVEPIPDKPVEQGNVHGPLLPLQKFELAQLALVGIIWDVKHPKAMIKDPTGSTHVVGTNTKVGPRNGYIAVIREGEMVVVETTEQEGKLVSSAQVVKIVH